MGGLVLGFITRKKESNALRCGQMDLEDWVCENTWQGDMNRLYVSSCYRPFGVYAGDFSLPSASPTLAH
jgi:hypothetical protein